MHHWGRQMKSISIRETSSAGVETKTEEKNFTAETRSSQRSEYFSFKNPLPLRSHCVSAVPNPNAYFHKRPRVLGGESRRAVKTMHSQ